MSANPWLPRRGASGESLRLLAFPFAGGGTAAFHGLSRHLPPTVELAPVLPPGRERRLGEAPLRSMGELLDALETALASELERPHAFLGHSLGALVAFELARRRSERGLRAPLRLFVSACRAPHVLSVPEPIHGLPDEAFLAAVEALGGMPAEVRAHAELVELMLPALRADFEVYETYRFEPGPQLACPITALGGERDREVPPAQLEAWGERSDGGFALHWLPAGHFVLQDDAPGAARIVRETLAAHAGATT